MISFQFPCSIHIYFILNDRQTESQGASTHHMQLQSMMITNPTPNYVTLTAAGEVVGGRGTARPPQFNELHPEMVSLHVHTSNSH